jgi:hypothetical protein
MVKTILFIIFGVLLFILFVYFAVFGRALNQEENHIGIIFALPEAILSSKAVRIDNQAYLTRDSAFFIKKMEEEGFSYFEQLGAGYIFKKEGESYTSVSRMYSSYFKIFSWPLKN